MTLSTLPAPLSYSLSGGSQGGYAIITSIRQFTGMFSMSRTITLTLPDDVLQLFEDKATAVERPVEDIIVETLKANPPDVGNYDEILQPLNRYTYEQLWVVVEQGLPPAKQTRLQQLNDKLESVEALTMDEEAELKRLLHEFDVQVLLRSHALVLLKERGQDIEAYLNTQRHYD